MANPWEVDWKAEPKSGANPWEVDWTAPAKPVEGGFMPSVKQSVGAVIKGAGQAASDFIPGVGQDNPLKRYGQSVIDANPTVVHGFEDAANNPGKTITEATGNAAGSVGGILGARALGMGITAAAPLTGPLAPVTALLGQAVAWLGPVAIASLPSYGGIRDKQILNDPNNTDDAKSKAIAALGAATVGAIETKFGPQNWALGAMTKEGRAALAEKFAETTLAKGIGFGALKGAAIEGGEELAQNPIEQLASYDNPLTKESLKDTAFSGFMGAVGGGVLGGATGGVAQGMKRETKEPASILQEEAPAIANIAKAGSADEAIAAFTASFEAGDSVRQQQSAQAFGAEKGILSGLPSIASLPPVGTADKAELDGLIASETADVNARRQGILQSSEADLNSLVTSENRDLQVMRANMQRDFQKQQELDQLQTTGRAVAGAASVTAPNAMQLAMEKARLKAMQQDVVQSALQPASKVEGQVQEVVAPQSVEFENALPTPNQRAPDTGYGNTPSVLEKPPATASVLPANNSIADGENDARSGSGTATSMERNDAGTIPPTRDTRPSKNPARLEQREPQRGLDGATREAPAVDQRLIPKSERAKEIAQSETAPPVSQSLLESKADAALPRAQSEPSKPSSKSGLDQEREQSKAVLVSSSANDTRVVSTFNGKFGKGMGKDAAKLEAMRLNRVNTDKNVTYAAEEHDDPKLENPWLVVGRKDSAQIAQPASVVSERESKPEPKSTSTAKAPSKPGSRLRSGAFDKNPLIAFVAKHGLFHDSTKPNSLKSEFSPDRQVMVPGYGPVFRKTGKNIDILTQDAIEEGYLPQDGTATQLYDLIRRAVAGEKILPLHAEGVAEAEGQRRADERQALEMDSELEQNAESTADNEKSAIESLGALSDDVLFDLDDSIGLDAQSNVSTESAMRSMGFTEQEIDDVITQEQAKAQTDSAGRGQSDETTADQAPPSAGQRNEEARSGSEGLTSPTREDVLANQERAEKADRAEKAQKKAQDLIDKKEQERKDIAARSVGAAESFTLGGDAEQNLTGQGGMFDDPAAKPDDSGPMFARSDQNSDTNFPTNEAHRDQTEKLQKALTGQGHNLTVTPVSVDADGNGQGRGAKNSFKLAEKLAGVFGKQVVWITAKGDFTINGVVIGGGELSNYVFINANTEKPAHVVLGHELTHHIEKDAPGIYKALVKSMEGLLRNHAGYRAKYGLQEASNTAITKEMIGDLMGDNFDKREFWNRVSQESNGLSFKMIARSVMKWLDGLLMKLRGFGSDQFVTDVNAARKALATALVDYQNTRGNPALLADGSLAPEFSASSRGTNEPVTNPKDVVGNQGGRSADDISPGVLKKLRRTEVIGDDGNPLLVYHGSKVKIDSFDTSKTIDGGLHFGSKSQAEMRESGNLHAVYLDARNLRRSKDTGGNWKSKIVSAKSAGHDGIVYLNRYEGISRATVESAYDSKINLDKMSDVEFKKFAPEARDSYIVFDPGQVIPPNEPTAPDSGGAFSRADQTDSPDIRFSLTDASSLNNPRGLVNAAVEHLNDRFNAPGTLNWWQKSIGTQYDLAQRSAPFKKVFDSVQNFINDTSFYATEAADLAPKLIPKLETWKDIFKKSISAQDSKAIAAPIFEGTLIWKRLANGQLSKTIGEEQGGVVFTADELKQRFGLTESQIELYKEFRTATDKSLTNLVVSHMVKLGGADVAPIADQALQAKNASEAGDLLSDYLVSLAEQDKNRSDVLMGTAAKMTELADKANSLTSKGYAPLSRFGSYTVDVISEGKRVYFGMFESKFEANQMAKRMQGNYPDSSIRQGTVSQEEYKLFAGVTPETLELFGEMLGLDSQGGDAKNQVFQEYLKAAKSNRSAMKRLIHRKGIEGFSEDASRVLAGFIYSNARQTSSNLHAGEITKATSEIPQGQGEVKDAAIKLATYVQNPQEEAQALRGLMFAQYIGGSVASAMVNLTQPFTMTLPWLSQYGGIAKAGKQMVSATRDALKAKTGDPELDKALRRAEEAGIVSPQEVHQLQQQASGMGVLKAGDGTKAGDAKAMASNAASRIMVGWGKLFGVAEQFNRRSTFIAAYRTAVEQGMDNPEAFAERAIAETQGIYNKGNKPAWARGAIGATLFTFKQFSISYVEMIGRMATGPNANTESRMAALNALAILVLVSGIGGLPGADDLDDVISGLLQTMGYNFDSKAKRRAFLVEHLGVGGQRFVQHGLSGLPGVPIDVSGRLGMGNLIPGTGLLTKKKDHTSDVAEFAGPAGDLFKRGFEAGGKVLKGDFVGASIDVSPMAARNVVKAFDMANMGMYRDQKGNKVIDTDMVEAVFKGVGFQPSSVKQVQDSTGEAQRMIGLNKIRETEIADKWAQGLFEKDADKTAEARQELLDWNADNPDMRIKIDYSQIFKRLKAMNQNKAQRIEKTAPKEIRSLVRQELMAQ